MPPLDEGTVLDMPITIPRRRLRKSTDDLKARDACCVRFPEVEMVVGKAGRAETPTDPAPPDMVETVVNLRPREHLAETRVALSGRASSDRDNLLVAWWNRGWVTRPSADQRVELANDATMFALGAFDQALRNMTFHDYASFEHQLAPRLDAERRRRAGRDCCDAGGKLKREMSKRRSDRTHVRLWRQSRSASGGIAGLTGRRRR